MMSQPERKKTESFPARLSPSLLSAVHVCLASRGASEQCIGYRAAPRCRLVV